MTALSALLLRDMRLAVRIGGGALMGVLFFLIVVTLVPFGVGPDLAQLQRIGPAILWIGALLASLLALDSLFASIQPNTVVLFSPFIRVTANKGTVALPAHIADFVRRVAAARPLVLTTFGNPYVLRQMPRAQAYLTTFGIGDALEAAVARAVTGTQPIRGRTPVSLPGFFAVGDGLSR